jgi:hypothetical protein
LPGPCNAFCIDPYDLALAKLALGRRKDMELLGELVKRSVLDPAELRRRFQNVAWEERRLFQTGRNLKRLLDAE